MFASFDPVAPRYGLCRCRKPSACNPRLYILDEREHCHHDHFTDIHPETNWKVALEHAEKLGIGTMEYELIEI